MPGPKSSTQSAPDARISSATASQRTGSTNCARARSAAPPSTGAQRSPAGGASKRVNASASAGEWNGTSTGSGVHSKRSGAPPRCPSRRAAASASATDAKRARTASRSAGGPASTIRVRVLTSATDTASVSNGSSRSSVTPSTAAIGDRPTAADAICSPWTAALRRCRASSASSITPPGASATSAAASKPCE